MRIYACPSQFIWILWICIVFSIQFACSHVTEKTEERPRFTLLTSEKTGLDFSNTLTSSKDFNVFHYMYFYNGGGVVVADFNQDGLTDIFFTANMESNGLYLNQDSLLFANVTRESGLEGMHGWTTGACVVDVNQDGLMDIYVNQLGDFRNMKGKNQLYICKKIDKDGIPHFKDEAEEYGLDLVGFGTQATFFDFDRDGDLDMFQLNHSVHNNGTFGQRQNFMGTMHPLAGDRLFRNENGKYTDVTATSGIHNSVIGYGLGVATGDVDLDGWPDIYVCNDFHENDYLYINQRDGTFREVLTEQIQHTSRFSMGVDIADINNDGYNDIFTLDMLPNDPHILKSSLGEDSYGTFQFKLGYGYNHQYARNNLQLNNRNRTFSEIGLLAGVFDTDWSWAALFFDFDQDGFKDLFISNGIPKRMNDIDYVNFLSNDEIQWKIRMDDMEEADLALEEKLPEVKVPNIFYQNSGALTFDRLINIDNDSPGFSYGAAYADFDNDGDLDVVVNNIGDAPFLYQNLTVEHRLDSLSYLQLRLKGTSQNRQAIGAKVIAYQGSARIIAEHFPVRGYQSSVEYGVHLGLGDLKKIDSIHLIWPDGTYQEIKKGLCNRISEVSWSPGLPVYQIQNASSADTQLIEVTDITAETGIIYNHRENPFVEFDREALIPHMTSAEGPPLAIGDINGDGREDVFIGASKRIRNAIFVQESGGTFRQSPQPALARDSLHEDVDAQFVDIDNDGDADLVIASGGNEFRADAEPMSQRLYRNDGKGMFVRDSVALKGIYMTAACVAPGDYDNDGDIDLFFGGRAEPWNYGVTPRSYLLENDGSGNFSDVTEKVNSKLAYAGLVRDAEWGDLDGDDQPDLVLAVEWGPIQIYNNRAGKLRDSELIGTNGLWNCISLADVDGDGDMDFFAGNLGLNSKLKASAEKPVRLYVSDFDQNGHMDQLLTRYIGDREILFPTYAEVTQQLPVIKKKFLFAKDFADASIEDLVGAENLRKAERLQVFVMENSWFENNGDGEFERHSLPLRLQFAPLRAAVVKDFNGDGLSDLMAMGNFYEANIEMGRYDADYGNILFNDGQGFNNGLIQSLKVNGQVRNIRQLKVGDSELMVIARNNAPVLVLRFSQADIDL